MGSTFYLFYMVLFTGGVLWCLFLWLARDDEEERENDASGDVPAAEAAEAPPAGASTRSVLDDRAGERE